MSLNQGNNASTTGEAYELATEAPDILAELERIRVWLLDMTSLPTFLHLSDYNDFCMELGNKARYLMMNSLSLCHPDRVGYPKTKAVVVGLYVRLFKLYDSLCLHFFRDEEEICRIFHRLILENILRLRYLMTHDDESALSFILISYRSIREQISHIKSIQATRPLLPIEKRILGKYEWQLEHDGLSFDLLHSQRNWGIDGKDVKSIWKDVYTDEWGYYFTFGDGSHAVHGDWKDVDCYHLKEIKGLYYPKPEFWSADPRVLNPITGECLDVSIEFLKWNGTDPDKYLISILSGLQELSSKFDEADEQRVVENSTVSSNTDQPVNIDIN